MVEECKHLTAPEQRQLLLLLQKFEHLFDGTLDTWNTDPVDLELKEPDTKPYHARPYPVPHSQEKKLRAEIERLCTYGVLCKINVSEWACPMFTIAKPDGSLRSLADLREVNKVIKRKPYPLPKITDMLQKLEGFMYATSLDLNMGYYHILLTPNARHCVQSSCHGVNMNIYAFLWGCATVLTSSKRKFRSSCKDLSFHAPIWMIY